MIARIRNVPQERALAYAVLGVIVTVVLVFLYFIIGGAVLTVLTAVGAITNLVWLALTWSNKWGRDGGRDA